MNSSFDYASFVTLGVFVLGILFTPLLKNWDFYLTSSKKKKILITELSDCNEYLRVIIIDHFKLLCDLESQADENGRVGKIPVPIVAQFDLDFLKDFYKASILVLSIDERHLIRGVPEKLTNIKEMSTDLVNDVSTDSFYNQRAIRNVLWASSVLYCELTDLLNKKYKRGDNLGSIDATKVVLIEFGFTEEEIQIADVYKSMLTESQRNSLNNNNHFLVP